MIRINELKLPLDEDEQELYRLAAKALKIGERHIRELTICKKSVDCRKTVSYTHLDVYKRQVFECLSGGGQCGGIGVVGCVAKAYIILHREL